MSSIKNVYFQNIDEDFYNEIYPFFINLKNSSSQNLNEEDQIYFNEIKDYITKNNSLPFKFNSQELLYFKKHPQSIWPDLLIVKEVVNSMKNKKWGRILFTSSIGTKFGGGKTTFAYSFYQNI